VQYFTQNEHDYVLFSKATHLRKRGRGIFSAFVITGTMILKPFTLGGCVPYKWTS
jgi:hypothetical protein